jgi:hypothetical protein
MSDNGDAPHETPPDVSPDGMIAYECPSCGQTLQAVAGNVPRLVDCPDCEERFLIPAEDGSTDLPEEEVSEENQSNHTAGELDSLRMRHMIVTRRTAIRSRTYHLVAAIGCIMAAIQLIIMTVTEVRHIGWHLRQAAFVAVAVGTFYGAVHFSRRAAYWSRESRVPFGPGDEGLPPPDFSTLSDGSQHARDLERM